MKENIRMMNISDELNEEECKKKKIKKTGLEVEIMKMHRIKKRYFYHMWKWVSLTTLHGKKAISRRLMVLMLIANTPG